MSWYTWAWLLWLAWFLAVEGVALANKRDGDTLSEHVWKWFHVRDPRPTWLVVVGRIVLGLFLLWLCLHLVFGWLTPTHPLPWLH
jgi:hypothetical protein